MKTLRGGLGASTNPRPIYSDRNGSEVEASRLAAIPALARIAESIAGPRGSDRFRKPHRPSGDGWDGDGGDVHGGEGEGGDGDVIAKALEPSSGGVRASYSPCHHVVLED